jgi:hypothetical protein
LLNSRRGAESFLQPGISRLWAVAESFGDACGVPGSRLLHPLIARGAAGHCWVVGMRKPAMAHCWRTNSIRSPTMSQCCIPHPNNPAMARGAAGDEGMQKSSAMAPRWHRDGTAMAPRWHRSPFGARPGFNQGRGFAPTAWDCSGAGAPPPRSVPRAVHSPRWQYPASYQRDVPRAGARDRRRRLLGMKAVPGPWQKTHGSGRFCRAAADRIRETPPPPEGFCCIPSCPS